MTSELKAVVVNEQTGELEYINVEDFVDVDTSGVSHEVEIVAVDEFRQIRQIRGDRNSTSTTQSITKPIAVTAGSAGSTFHHHLGSGGNIRSTPSLLRNSRSSGARSHGSSAAASSSSSSNQGQFLQVQNASNGSFFIPMVQDGTNVETSYHHQLVHAPSILPPASAQFIRAVEATATAGGSSEGGTQLVVFNGETSNFDVIPQDGNQNLQLRLCQVVNEEGDDGNGNTIYICEEQPGFNQDSNEYPNIQIVEELPMPILQDAEGNVYEVEEFHHHGSFANDLALHYPAAKRRKKTARNGTTTKDGQTKVPKRPVNELKCLEVGCGFAGVNVSELRKHLTSVHFMSFDEETLHFTSEKEFKSWRETYERERMVSFIFRGGTKKISRDQAVTYLICHRSGHYKPTMKDQSLRKRKMKPQGSCKMNGYCTAGIKLLKNLESGDVKCEICHTHYGHPLDSGAIPHLRVNNMLRKIIWKKFEEGMSFNQVVQYLHHNPDQLEGLRLLDRRAVRNIYDKFKKNPGRSFLDDEDYDDTLSPSNFNDGDESMDVKSPADLQQQQQDQKPSLVSVQMDFNPDSADDSKIPTFTLYQVPNSSQDDEESNQNLILVSTIDTSTVTMEDITGAGGNVDSVVIDNTPHNVTTITTLEGEEERIVAESDDLTLNDEDIQQQQISNETTSTIKVAKKRGRKPKVKLEQLEEQPQSPVDVEIDHDPFFDRSDNSSGTLGGENGSPIRRSQRERKRKLFHDEEEKKNLKMRNTPSKVKFEPLELFNEKRKDKSPSTSGPSLVLVGTTTNTTPVKPVGSVTTTTRNNDKLLSSAASSSCSFISIASDEDEDKLSPPTLLKFDSEKTVPSPASTSSSGGGKLDLEPPVLEKIQCDNDDIHLVHDDNNIDGSSQMTETIICDDDTATTITTDPSDNVNKIIEEASWASDEHEDNDGNWNPPASLKPKKSMVKTKKVVRVPSKATRLSSSSADTDLQLDSQKMLNAQTNSTSLPFNIQDCISDEVKAQIQDLLQHGESGPTVLMYKKFGISLPEYGPKDLPFRKEDFCLVIQTPVQRQLMQQFSDVVYIDGHKGRQKDLKLMFIMVLDEFREAIPVAWLISNSTDDRMVSIFLKVLKDHCGCDMQTYYLMAPINSNYCRIWSSVFYPKEDKNNLGVDEEEEQQEQLPQMILNEEDTKRDMRIEVAEIFADSVTRKKLNGFMHSMMYAVDQDTIDSVYTQLKDYLESEHGDKGREFLFNFEKNWIDKAPQWSLIYRIGSPTNTLYVSESFGKLKKFIAFKGTKILSSVIDPVLKIGYDKCFSRSKRLFKGDQKLMKTQDDIAMFHQKSTEIPPECFQPKISVCARIIDDGNNRNEQDLVDSDHAWIVVDPENDAEHTVIDLKSPCRCRFICLKCDVCVHKYMCSCSQSQVEHQMCPHIHFVHSQLRFRDKKIKWIPVSASSITGHNVDDMETIVIEAIQETDD